MTTTGQGGSPSSGEYTKEGWLERSRSFAVYAKNK